MRFFALLAEIVEHVVPVLVVPPHNVPLGHFELPAETRQTIVNGLTEAPPDFFLLLGKVFVFDVSVHPLHASANVLRKQVAFLRAPCRRPARAQGLWTVQRKSVSRRAIGPRRRDLNPKMFHAPHEATHVGDPGPFGF